MSKYTVRVEIDYNSPGMTLTGRGFSMTYSDKDAAYQHYDELVNQYLGNDLMFVKVTLDECDVDGDTKMMYRVLKSWDNMSE